MKGFMNSESNDVRWGLGMTNDFKVPHLTRVCGQGWELGLAVVNLGSVCCGDSRATVEGCTFRDRK
jgi:hypothetical protein